MLETFLRWFLALLLVAPLAYWGSRLYFKVQHPWAVLRGARESGGSRKRLEVLEVLPLGPGKMLWLVRADQRLLVIGSGEKDVRLIATLPPHRHADQSEKNGKAERGDGWARHLPG
ncbi:MAG: flagellar biosynthetic protein FliO [Limnochordales bacterium]|nr:flagellar biosynthetic protein FliO [Limnochordales bacterium]